MRAHLGVEPGIVQHRLQIGALLLLGAEGLDRRDDRLELAELARQRGIFGAGDAFRQARADLLVTAQDEIEIVVGGHCQGTRKESSGRGRALALQAHFEALGERAQGLAQRGLGAALDQHRRRPRARSSWMSSDSVIALTGPIDVADIERSR